MEPEGAVSTNLIVIPVRLEAGLHHPLERALKIHALEHGCVVPLLALHGEHIGAAHAARLVGDRDGDGLAAVLVRRERDIPSAAVRRETHAVDGDALSRLVREHVIHGRADVHALRIHRHADGIVFPLAVKDRRECFRSDVRADGEAPKLRQRDIIERIDLLHIAERYAHRALLLLADNAVTLAEIGLRPAAVGEIVDLAVGGAAVVVVAVGVFERDGRALGKLRFYVVIVAVFAEQRMVFKYARTHFRAEGGRILHYVVNVLTVADDQCLEEHFVLIGLRLERHIHDAPSHADGEGAGLLLVSLRRDLVGIIAGEQRVGIRILRRGGHALTVNIEYGDLRVRDGRAAAGDGKACVIGARNALGDVERIRRRAGKTARLVRRVGHGDLHVRAAAGKGDLRGLAAGHFLAVDRHAVTAGFGEERRRRDEERLCPLRDLHVILGDIARERGAEQRRLAVGGDGQILERAVEQQLHVVLLHLLAARERQGKAAAAVHLVGEIARLPALLAVLINQHAVKGEGESLVFAAEIRIGDFRRGVRLRLANGIEKECVGD